MRNLILGYNAANDFICTALILSGCVGLISHLLLGFGVSTLRSALLLAWLAITAIEMVAHVVISLVMFSSPRDVTGMLLAIGLVIGLPFKCYFMAVVFAYSRYMKEERTMYAVPARL